MGRPARRACRFSRRQGICDHQGFYKRLGIDVSKVPAQTEDVAEEDVKSAFRR